MSYPEKKQKQLLSRAQHQLREIELSCREVVNFAQNIKLVGGEVDDSDMNCKKIQLIKCEMKEKLREVASNIDEVYRVLDRKIVILTAELKKELKNHGCTFLSGNEQANYSLAKGQHIQKESQGTHERSNPSLENERHFSETLNPRVAQLESKVADHERREALLNSKIVELKQKNQRLLEEFNKLSTASNKKINQLSSDLQNHLSRDRDSFTGMDSNQLSRQKTGDRYKPFLTIDLQTQPSSRSPHKIKQKAEEEYYDYAKTDSVVDQKSHPFTFGCMPAARPKQQNSGLLSFPWTQNDSFQNLNKEDRSRRFDLLLNKLRYTEQKGKTGCSVAPSAAPKSAPEEFGSVFSKQVVNRYQV